jgi:hypothetical protein
VIREPEWGIDEMKGGSLTRDLEWK